MIFQTIFIFKNEQSFWQKFASDKVKKIKVLKNTEKCNFYFIHVSKEIFVLKRYDYEKYYFRGYNSIRIKRFYEIQLRGFIALYGCGKTALFPTGIFVRHIYHSYL